MFSGDDPDGEGYSTRAHLAELIGMLGPPSHDLLEAGRRVDEFFDANGMFSRSAATCVSRVLTAIKVSSLLRSP